MYFFGYKKNLWLVSGCCLQESLSAEMLSLGSLDLVCQRTQESSSLPLYLCLDPNTTEFKIQTHFWSDIMWLFEMTLNLESVYLYQNCKRSLCMYKGISLLRSLGTTYSVS